MAEIDGAPDLPAGRSRRLAVWAIAGAAVLLIGGVAFAVSASHHHSHDVAAPTTDPTRSSAGTTAPAPPTTAQPSTTKAVKPRTTPSTKPRPHSTQPASTAPHATVAGSHTTIAPVVIPATTVPRPTTPPATAPPTTHPHPVTTTTVSPTSPFAKITGPSPACIGASSYSYAAVSVRNGAYGYWTYLNVGVPVIKTWNAGQSLAVAFHGPAGTHLSIDLSLSNSAGVTRDFHKQVTMINC